MTREPINWKVEKKDIKEFIKPINIEINIDKNLYKYIFFDGMDEDLIDLEKEIMRRIFKKEEFNIYEKAFLSKLSLSYTPDFKNKNWVIRYSPIQIINTIYEIAGINIKLDYMDYNNEHEVRKLTNEVRSELSGYISYLENRNEVNKQLIEFLNSAAVGLENIMLLKDYDIEISIDKATYYKNLLLYLASKSLDIYMDTENNKEKQENPDMKYATNNNKGNPDYYILPKQYYNEVSGKKRAQKPYTIHDTFEGEDINYESFNNRYIKTLRDNPTLVDDTLDLETIHVMDRLEAVTADCFTKDIGIIYENVLIAEKKNLIKPPKNKTVQDIINMLEEKVKFYHKLTHMQNKEGQNEVAGVFRGKIDLYGYYGFILRNNYIVLDSFFKLNSDNQIVPSSEEAIYILPIDLFVQLNGSKSKMMDYKKEHENSEVDRRYHTDNLSFRDRVMEAMRKDNISVMNDDWFLSIYAPHEEIVKK